MSNYCDELLEVYGRYGTREEIEQVLERQRRAREKPLSRFFNFLSAAFATVCAYTPAWGFNVIKTAPYDMDVAETAIIDSWPKDMEPREFGGELVRFVVGQLEKDDFSCQTQVGWFLATMTNILARHNQSDVIFSDVLPEVYSQQSQKGSICEVLGRMLPAMREQLNEAVIPQFEENQRPLLESIFAEECITRAASRLCSYMSDGLGIGAYELHKGCADQGGFLFRTIGIPRIVDRFADHLDHWEIASLFNELFEKSSPDQGRTLALALYAYCQPQGLLRITGNLLKSDTGASAVTFNTGLLAALPSQEKESYTTRLLTLEWRDALIGGAVSNPEYIARFIGALPEGAAHEMVRDVVNEAMGFKLEASPDYWWQSKYADRLHQMVPERYWPVCEEVVLEHLSAYPSDRDCLIRASLILRGILANDQTCRTRDVDFIHVTPKSPYKSTIVFIKPLPDRQDSGIVMINDFIGTMSDLEESIRNPATGMPCDQPPHRREIGSVRKYAPYIETIKAGMAGTPDTQVSLRETLRRRQQYHLRTQPRRALPAPG